MGTRWDIGVGSTTHARGTYFEATVLGQLEGVADGCDGVAAVGVLGDVFVDALHAYLDARAAVAQHLRQVRLQAVVRPGLDRDADTFRSDKVG